MMKKYIFSSTLIALFFLVSLAFRPLMKENIKNKYHSSTAVYSREGSLLRLTLSNDQKFRQWVPLNKISKEIQRSLIITEDRYFNQHLGVNPWSLLRAGWTTYFGGGRKSGASTITMQLSRMLYKINSKSLPGKSFQILTSLWLEYLYSKEEILEAYLNLVPMGGNIEGVGAASLIFFQKRPSEIKWAEALLLAAIPQNPQKRTLLSRFSKELKDARLRIYQNVADLIPKTEQRLIDIDAKAASLKTLPFHAPHFTENILRRSTGNYEVQTTLDLSLQKIFEKKLNHFIEANKKNGIKNGGILLMNWKTREVLAWIGSSDYFNKDINGQVDAVTSLRSPGSALKPFIYALAIEQGVIHPGTVLKDSPKSFGSYDPENFDSEFNGPISAEDALNQSRNIPAVELVTKIKDPDFYQFLVNTGVGIPRNRDHYGHSIALGGFELSLLELVELYAVLPNKGYISKGILSLDEKRKIKTPQKILSEEAAFSTLEILSKNDLSTRKFRNLRRMSSFPVSWKTGTSSGFKDAWTLGVFGQFAMGLWFGNFSGESNRNFIGRELVAPLFFDLIDVIRLKNGITNESYFAWVPPRNVKKTSVCSVSGKLPTDNCKHRHSVTFIPGVSPIEKCDVHRQIWVSKKDGTLSCRPDPSKDRPIVFEYWSSDLLELFAKAGLPRKLPPKRGNNCSALDFVSHAELGLHPEILSPREGSTYTLRSKSESDQLIPLEANLDASSKEIFWFIDSEYIGKSFSNSALLWKARNGEFLLKAIDDLGRSSSRVLKVEYVD